MSETLGRVAVYELLIGKALCFYIVDSMGRCADIILVTIIDKLDFIALGELGGRVLLFNALPLVHLIEVVLL